MSLNNYTDLVGILVGKILKDAPPLAISLYFRPSAGRHARVSEMPEFKDTYAAMVSIEKTYEAAVQCVWGNCSTPGWYYIQLAPGHSPAQVGFYPLPWSTYRRWRVVERGE